MGQSLFVWFDREVGLLLNVVLKKAFFTSVETSPALPASVMITVASQTVNTGCTHDTDDISVTYCNVKLCFPMFTCKNKDGVFINVLFGRIL